MQNTEAPLVLVLVAMKYCPCCKKEKQISLFSKDKNRPDKLCSQCKECAAARSLEHRSRLQQRVAIEYPTTSVCCECKIEKPASDFYVSKQHCKGLTGVCKSCDRKRKRRYRYGLLGSDLKKLENLPCGICGVLEEDAQQQRSFHVDHDHQTGLVRGILCQHCNIGLGHFKDNPELLQNAILYLQQSKELSNAA